MKTATYLRVSTTEQTHDPQRAELANWGRIIMMRARVRCCSSICSSDMGIKPKDSPNAQRFLCCIPLFNLNLQQA